MVPPNLAGCLLVSLYGYHFLALLLPILLVRTLAHLPPSCASQRTSCLLCQCSWQFYRALGDSVNSENCWELGKTAWVQGYEKPRGAQRSTEKVGATEGIQSAEEGGSPLKLARARKDFQSFFEVSFLGKNFSRHV